MEDDPNKTPPRRPVSLPTHLASSTGPHSTPFRRNPYTNIQFASKTELTKKKRNPVMPLWRQHVSAGFTRVVEVREFLNVHMNGGLPGIEPTEDDISTMETNGNSAHQKLVQAVRRNGHESRLYKPLANYLNALFQHFDAEERPYFADTHSTVFQPLHPTDHDSMPDIAHSLHGDEPDKWRWLETPGVVEAKPKLGDMFDPNNKAVGKSEEARNSLLQLLHNTRRIMMARRSCYTFVVAVFDKHARFFRVDRCGFVVSEKFDWTKETRLFPEFYWRLYKAGGKGVILGDDSTVTIPTKEELLKMSDVLKTLTGENSELQPTRETRPANKQSVVHPDLVDSRWINVMIDNQVRRCLTVGLPIHQSTGMFSRGTRVDRVLLENDPHPKFYVLKDSWLQACRYPEYVFYEIIQNYVKTAPNLDAMSQGLTTCVGKYDLGRADKYADAGHCTITARLRDDGLAGQERLHQRTLTSDVGQHLDELKSMQHVILALRDAVRGHKVACDAGVIHRDVSIGNILKRLEPLLAGFLHDFDVSCLTEQGLAMAKKLFPKLEHGDMDKNLKELTGTYPFLAIDLLEARRNHLPIQHKSKHDLESFFWILIWIVFRHTNHSEPSGVAAASELFDAIDDYTASAVKMRFLDGRITYRNRLVVPENQPLSYLIDALAALVRNSTDLKYANPTIPLTHEAFLSCLDSALAKPNWPENDLLGFKLPSIEKKKENEPSFPAIGVRWAVSTDTGHALPLDDDEVVETPEDPFSVTSTGRSSSSRPATGDSWLKRKRENEPILGDGQLSDDENQAFRAREENLKKRRLELEAEEKALEAAIQAAVEARKARVSTSAS
ncbi:hypothetical protein MIND_00097200 [Mycena indigotica]|uniref:Fungal-type protein kinase domain-containing protein n=1 Tax=Mycena indigotica TaxID=2126181 RepID=A0A8H6WGG0_9AGAR|nr:uncharacterized protein MIND_00097200 [Mycena indigotica]KAF7315811.1 hypothetical protein MIND_00097200 [Mycena indigotica]